MTNMTLPQASGGIINKMLFGIRPVIANTIVNVSHFTVSAPFATLTTCGAFYKCDGCSIVRGPEDRHRCAFEASRRDSATACDGAAAQSGPDATSMYRLRLAEYLHF